MGLSGTSGHGGAAGSSVILLKSARRLYVPEGGTARPEADASHGYYWLQEELLSNFRVSCPPFIPMAIGFTIYLLLLHLEIIPPLFSPPPWESGSTSLILRSLQLTEETRWE